MASVQDFLDLLPQFDGTVSNTTIQAWLDEAARTVGTDWTEADRAQIMLAAHLMSINGLGPEKGARALVGLKSFRSGSFSIVKDQKDVMGDFALSSFGVQYWGIQQSERGGPRVTGSGDWPWPWGSTAGDVDPWVPPVA